MEGLADLEGGPVAIDLHRVFGIDLTDEVLETRTWQWLVQRCYSLIDHDTYMRRAALGDI